METIRQNGKTILHGNDGISIKCKDGFQKPYGQEFSRSGIYRLYPAYRNRQHGIFTRYHRALQGR